MMRLPTSALALALACLLTAGCIGGGTPSSRPPTPPTGPPPTSEPPLDQGKAPAGPAANVTHANGTVAGVWAPGVAYFAASGKHTFEVNVTNATRALVIEVAWRTQDKLSLKADVPANYCTGTDPLGFLVNCPSPKPNDLGTSPARIEVTDAATLARVGTWQIGVWAQQSPTEAPFQIAITTFTGGLPPQGYSALLPR